MTVPASGMIWQQQSGENNEIEEVEIESANRLEQSTLQGELVRVLEGNVRLRHEETQMRARRVFEYLERNQVLLMGDVLIIERGDSLTADSVLYDKRLKRGTASGDVRLTDGDVNVFSPTAQYYTEEKWAVFDQSVKLVDSVSVMTSQKGEYFSDEKRAEFFGEVALTEDRTYLEADSVTYFRETEISIGRGNVFIERWGGAEEQAEDTSGVTLLFGRYAYNDNQERYSLIEGNAFLVQLQPDSVEARVDTLLISASRLESIREDSLQRLIAVDSVEIWRDRMSALADSVVYDRITETDSTEGRDENRFYKQPVAWFNDYQITGDTIRATGKRGGIDSLFVQDQAFSVQQDSLLQRLNQIKGQRLIGLFLDDQLERIQVGPRAEAIYYQKDENDGPNGAIKASGDRIELQFAGNELRRFNFISGIEGSQFPEHLLPQPFELEGLRWIPEERPTREGLLQSEQIIAILERYKDQFTPGDTSAQEQDPVSNLDPENPRQP